jgi:hypothetical protein
MRPLLFSLIMVCFACGEENLGPSTIRVNHFQQPAFGEAPQLVLLIQEDENIGTDNWEFLYSGIEGFEFENGFRYQLSIRKKKINNPPADGSSIRYILKDVISKTAVPVTEEFEMILQYGNSGPNETLVFENEDGGFSILGEIEMDCSDLCDELSQALSSTNEITGIFTHADDDVYQLQELLTGQ